MLTAQHLGAGSPARHCFMHAYGWPVPPTAAAGHVRAPCMHASGGPAAPHLIRGLTDALNANALRAEMRRLVMLAFLRGGPGVRIVSAP